MRSLFLIIAGLVCTLVWLVLLEATSFSSLVVSAGLLGFVLVTGRIH